MSSLVSLCCGAIIVFSAADFLFHKKKTMRSIGRLDESLIGSDSCRHDEWYVGVFMVLLLHHPLSKRPWRRHKTNLRQSHSRPDVGGSRAGQTASGSLLVRVLMKRTPTNDRVIVVTRHPTKKHSFTMRFLSILTLLSLAATCSGVAFHQHSVVFGVRG